MLYFLYVDVTKYDKQGNLQKKEFIFLTAPKEWESIIVRRMAARIRYDGRGGDHIWEITTQSQKQNREIKLKVGRVF